MSVVQHTHPNNIQRLFSQTVARDFCRHFYYVWIYSPSDSESALADAEDGGLGGRGFGVGGDILFLPTNSTYVPGKSPFSCRPETFAVNTFDRSSTRRVTGQDAQRGSSNPLSSAAFYILRGDSMNRSQKDSSSFSKV